ncbi:hypothetical protein D3C84_670670 [compost metagenome]
MAIKADGDHVRRIPLAGLTYLAVSYQFLQHLQPFLILQTVIRVFDLELIELQHRPVVFFHADYIVKLSLVAGFQRFVEAVGVIRQQTNEDVLLLTNVVEPRHRQLRRRNVQRVPVR